MRILNALKGDMKFQFKQGFYFVYIIVTILYMLIIDQLPTRFENYAVPMVVFTDPSFVGFFFIGGIVMLEKGQGILQYLIITPLRPKEYLISKVISLSALAVIAGFTIAFVTYNSSFNWLLLFLGILQTSVFFTLYGFLVACGCNTINQYFLKMIPYIMILVLPTLLYFVFPHIWFLRIIPSIGGFKLVFGAFNGISILEAIGYVGYLTVINFVTLLVVERYFMRNIVKG